MSPSQEKRAALKRERVNRRADDARAVAEQQRKDKYRTAFEATQKAFAGLGDGDDAVSRVARTTHEAAAYWLCDVANYLPSEAKELPVSRTTTGRVERLPAALCMVLK